MLQKTKLRKIFGEAEKKEAHSIFVIILKPFTTSLLKFEETNMKNLAKFFGIIAIIAMFALLAGCGRIGNNPTVSSVVVNPQNPTVLPGGTIQFTATVLGTNNPPQDVTWSVQGGTGITISATGLLTATEYASSWGSITVHATSIFDNRTRGSASVTLTDISPTVTSVTVNPQTASVVRGGTHNFTATVLGTNNPPQDVTWSVAWWGGGSLQPGTGISATGQLTVDNNQAVHSQIRVRATSAINTWQYGAAIVTVTDSAGPAATVTSIVMNPQTASVAPGGTHNFTATVLGTNNPPQSVTWTLGWACWRGLQPGTGISATGQLTVDANQASGSEFEVRATSTHTNWVVGTATVTVQ